MLLRKFSTFVELLQYRALDRPDKIAFTFLPDGETELKGITYQELDKQARAIAAILQNLKAKGERALLLYPPGLDFVSAFFGCLYAGAIAVPAYPPRQNRSISRLNTIVSDAQANFALTTTSVLSTIEGKLSKPECEIVLLTTDNIDYNLASDWQETKHEGNTLAFLQYTSGSTGTPKGVMVTHANLLHNSASSNECFQDNSDNQGVSWLPPYHDMGLIGGILQPIYLGASMALMSPVTFLQRPLRWLQAISRYQATSTGSPNFGYELCVSQITPEQKETLDLSTWELAFCGAEPVRAETIERFSSFFAPCGFRKQAFNPCYGMAENTLIVSGGSRQALPVIKTFKAEAIAENRVVIAEAGKEGTLTLVGCGQGVSEQEIVIVNPETLCRTQPDEIGEIWVSGKSVAQGYWNRKTQTEETFAAYITGTNEGPFLRTGDLGFLQDKELFVTGRIKDLIIIRGRNHYPQDIEFTVDQSHPALRASCGAAFAVDIDGEERLAIVQEVQRSYLRNLNVEEVISSIRKAVLQHHELQTFAVVLLKTGSIPKTSSGKIQRHACKAEFIKGNLQTVGEWKQDLAREDTGAKGHGDAGKIQIDPLRIAASPTLGVRADSNPPQPHNGTQWADAGSAPVPPPHPNSESIQVWLISKIAQRLDVPPQEIDILEPLINYGLDSVQAVRLSAELEDWLGCKLSPTLVYDYPTIESLSLYLSRQDSKKESSKNPPPTALEAIAIIGMACRFPGANNPEEFWQLLRNGKDAITQVNGRWNGNDWGGFLDRVDLFDSQFFGISPREAIRIDPQQRLLLEVCWEALENAAVAPEKLSATATGVFIGISSSDYSQLQFRYGTEVNAYVGTGNAHSIAANRLSYFFDLRGPSISVDTACSSSLVALHLGCQSLRQKECDRAIVGGVNLILSPELTLTFTEAGMMAADGRCKTFDANADGYVRGEGCAVVLLKRLSDAVKDNDNILAVIKGSAVNQDGRSNGLTAPNGPAQQAVIQQALLNAGVNPAEISCIEAHGTGTSLGDPIEINSLKALLMQERDSEQPCWIGSVKTNIGHLEAAAGIAGLIKMVLCLQHQEIPPHLHLKQLNPHIDLSNTPLSVPTEIKPWTKKERSRLAGVSSFGFGGTNAHVVLAEWQALENVKENISWERPLHILTLSAKNETTLKDLIKNYEEYLTHNLDISLADVCFTTNTGRSHFKYRIGIIAESKEELLQKLVSAEVSQVGKGIERKIAFLFTGQGSQYAGMGYQLYQTQPTFRAALDKCAQILQLYLEQPLLEILYPESNPSNSKLDLTVYTQPALFALEYSLFQLWLSWGIKPDAVIGHSVGEYVAACIAGVFSLEDGLKLIVERARLMQALPQNGEMVAVFATEEAVAIAIEPYKEKVAIAAINAPENIVISGETEAVAQIIAKFQSQEIKTQKLTVSHAFHSPLMEPMLEAFDKVARKITYSVPSLNIVSNVTGEIATTEMATPEYWVNHVRQPVKFDPSIKTLHALGYQIFLEIGSKPTLLGMGRQCLPEGEELWLPSLHPAKQDWQQMLDSLDLLYKRGIKIDWAGFDRDYLRKQITSLPNYPFQRQRYWIEEKQPVQQAIHPTNPDWFYKVDWQVKSPNFASPQTPLEGGEVSRNLEENWLVFADQKGLGKSLAEQLEQKGHNCLLVYRGEKGDRLDEKTWNINPENLEDFQHLFSEICANISQFQGIIHLWSLDTASLDELNISTLEQAQIYGCASVLHLIQTLCKQAISSKIWLVTRGTQPINSQINPTQSPLWGLGKVIALEHPQLWGGMLDLALDPDTDEAAILLAEIINSDKEDYLAFRDGQVYVPRLKKWEKDVSVSDSITINSESTYLITGGLGALGLKVAQWMVQEGARYLVLVGRNAPKDNAAHTIQTLEQTGAKILVAQADVSQEQDVARILEAIATPWPPLKGIIHAAGVIKDGILQGQNWERFTQVMAPKIQGTWNLHHLTKHLPLDFFVMFSSAASLLGSPGQGNYAAANTFLDAIAQFRQAKGLAALSINWGAWEETGMAKNKRLTRGLNPIPVEKGLQAIAELIAQKPAQIGFISANWATLSQQFPYSIQSPYFQEIIKELSLSSTEKEPTQTAKIFEQLVEMLPQQKEEFLTTYLQSAIARILHLKTEQISITDSLLDLGLDSLMIMEAIAQLKSDLQLMLYPREFYERPRINSLAKYLAVEFERIHSKEDAETRGLKETGKIQIDTRRVRADCNPPQHSPHPTPYLAYGNTPQPYPIKLGSKSPKAKIPGIVFILSSPRSGSTLLRVMLAGHPALSSPPELHLLPFNTMGEREQELGISHLSEGLQRAFMELKSIDAQASQELVKNLVASNLSIQDVYAILQNLAGDRLLVDKSPTYATQRETLEKAEELFANAKYIHLVRHPYAVIESFARMRMDKLIGADNANPYQLAESIWANSNQNVLDFFEQIEPKRRHQIKYEDLVAQPEKIMVDLCEFLNIPFNPSVLTPYEGERMTDGVYAKSMSLGDPNFLNHKQIEAKLADNWRTIKLPHQLGDIARRIATSLDYELPFETETPSTLQTMKEHFLDVRGLKLCICSWGPEAGPLVVCLHGILEQGAAWSEVAVRLVEKGYRVVAPDLRGHGRSDHADKGGSYYLLDFLADIDTIVEKITDKAFTLVGHSLGSVIAALFTSVRPQKVKNLILVETILPTEADEDETADRLTTHLDYLASPPKHPVFPDAAAASDRLRQVTPGLSHSLAMKLAQRITEPCAGGVTWRWASLLLTRAGISFSGIGKTKYLSLLKRIKVPITLIYGDQSNFNRTEDLLAQQIAMPKAEHIVLSGGHNLHLEAPSQIAQIIK